MPSPTEDRPPLPVPQPAPRRPSEAGRYLFLFLLGLVLGIVAVVMLLRALDARKTWRDHYPNAAMQVMSAHVAQLREKVEANRCNPTDVLPHLQSLRSLGNDLEPAFAGLRDDRRFAQHAGRFRATLDGALGSPPLNCGGAAEAMKTIGEACTACHQDFRG
jgi:cytochrome c556